MLLENSGNYGVELSLSQTEEGPESQAVQIPVEEKEPAKAFEQESHMIR